VYDITLGPDGSTYLSGTTLSVGFPPHSAPGTAPTAVSGDAFVTRISPDGHTVLYSTFLGANGFDAGLGIDVDAKRAAYVNGFDPVGQLPDYHRRV